MSKILCCLKYNKQKLQGSDIKFIIIVVLLENSNKKKSRKIEKKKRKLVNLDECDKRSEAKNMRKGVI